MKDFPVFTTCNGVASLVLREVPYRQVAYIHLQDSKNPEALLKECVDFCLAVGAERIYATGHSCLEKYPLHTAVIRMQCPKECLPETDAALFPVQEHTLEQWRSIYNEKMQAVPSASYMTQKGAKEMLAAHTAYFVHRGDQLLGIGSVDGGKLEALAAVVPGAGKDVVLALCNAIFSDTVWLEVATENHRAVNLYRQLGFLPVKEVSRWYHIDK